MRIESAGAARPAGVVARAEPRPASLAAGVSATVVRDLAGLDAIEAEWRDLERRIDGLSFFAGFDWTRAWWTHFGEPRGSSLAVVAVRRAGRLVAVMPLLVDRAGPYAWATLAGAGSGRYAAIAVDAPEGEHAALHEALWQGLRATGADTLVVDNVPDRSALAAFLAGRRGIVGARTQSYEVLSGSYAGFDAYLASRPSGFAKTLRRRRRRLAEEGPLSYEVVSDREEVESAALPILEMKLRWLADRGLHGRFLGRRETAAWLKEITLRAGERLHLSMLKVGGRIVAAQYAFVDGRRLTCYLAAFDLEFARQAAGKLHFEDLAREAFATGRDLDLMPPADDYKREWGTEGAPASSVTVPITGLGSAAALVHNARVRERLKHLYLAAPAAARAGAAERIQRWARALAQALAPAVRKPSSPPDCSSEERHP